MIKTDSSTVLSEYIDKRQKPQASNISNSSVEHGIYGTRPQSGSFKSSGSGNSSDSILVDRQIMTDSNMFSEHMYKKTRGS